MKLFCILSVLLLASVEPSISSLRRYNSIFSFGDSVSDSGNGIIILGESSAPNPAAHLPYGQTFFGHPTGRSSNGRLIIDFIAEWQELPYVPPSLSHNGNFSQGANFAVSGSTALDVSLARDAPFASQFVLASSMQLRWFESLKPSLCSPAQACPPGFFHKSLFVMGEFGINDYHFALSGKKTLAQVRSIVPDVVRAIAVTIEGLIKQGARTVFVPGIPPLGCLPRNLELFPSADPAVYEPRTGCLKEFNELAMHHNSLLKETLENVRRDHPNAVVNYADFFTHIIRMVESPSIYGFTADVLRCCCGGGGKYNYNISARCGMPGATVRKHPSTYMFWDGHFTEATYRYTANRWVNRLRTQDHLMGATYESERARLTS